MKFLIDENVSADVAAGLRRLGHDVLTSSDANLRGRADPDVMRRANTDGRILITRDRHFTNPARFPPGETEGILFIRHGNRTGPAEAALVEHAIQQIKADDIRCALLTVGATGLTRR